MTRETSPAAIPADRAQLLRDAETAILRQVARLAESETADHDTLLGCARIVSLLRHGTT